MVRTFNSKLNRYIHHIYQGDIYIGYKGEIISTVLGSCIAVCLYDIRREVGGMNHALLPFRTNNKELDDDFYCDLSVKKMINQFLDDGSYTENLKAKVFGGSDLRESDRIGERNIESALKVLKSYNIKIYGMDTGGVFSRKLYYKSKENRVFLKHGESVD